MEKTKNRIKKFIINIIDWVGLLIGLLGVMMTFILPMGGVNPFEGLYIAAPLILLYCLTRLIVVLEGGSSL